MECPICGHVLDMRDLAAVLKHHDEPREAPVRNLNRLGASTQEVHLEAVMAPSREFNFHRPIEGSQ